VKTRRKSIFKKEHQYKLNIFKGESNSQDVFEKHSPTRFEVWEDFVALATHDHLRNHNTFNFSSKRGKLGVVLIFHSFFLSFVRIFFSQPKFILPVSQNFPPNILGESYSSTMFNILLLKGQATFSQTKKHAEHRSKF